MKRKPSIDQFKPRKDPTAFLDGAVADVAEKPVALPADVPGDGGARRGRGRVQKIFNFPEELADRLRDEAAARSRQIGSRVSEKDIVVEALEAYLGR
jgi:hypothetical protein